VAACLPLESTVQELFQSVAFSSPSVLLESARTHPVTGRYSILTGEPSTVFFAKANQIWLTTKEGTRTFQGDPLAELQNLLDAQAAVRVEDLPPFVGGAVGFFGFDAYRYVEMLPSKAADDLHLPDLGFLFCDQAVVLDHLLKKLWVIVLADPRGDPDRSYDAAVARVDALIERATRTPPEKKSSFPRKRELDPRFRDDDVVREDDASAIRSTHTRESFEEMVRHAKRFIAEGDIYQANLSQRFCIPLSDEPWALYRRLTAVNPSPFAAFADFGTLPGGETFQIVSASPERFLRLRDDQVETRPIAGTRPKGTSAVETARLRQELILNEKERAEHLMLVDLERNDLGRVCRFGSVRVDSLMELEEYSHVIHIVSNVQGEVRPGVRPLDLIPATFPGGTITGCPKIRSVEIIDALEPVRRQLYTGALGYISVTGDMDLNLLIRTGLVVDDFVYVQAGAGIVADSDPGREFEETVHKARALMETFHSGSGSSSRKRGSIPAFAGMTS